MRLVGLCALALSAPVMAQDVALDAADGFPLEARYTDNSDDFPRDAVARGSMVHGTNSGEYIPLSAPFLSLKNGETIIVRFNEAGRPIEFRYADKDTPVTHGEMRATLNSLGGNSRLTVLTRGLMPLNYSAINMESGPTIAVCTLVPGIASFELWPFPINEIAIGEFTSAPEGEISCR